MESSVSYPKRLDWLDRAKGLGMLLVIFGHMSQDPVLTRPIYLFHIPLFFILSGMARHMSRQPGRSGRNTARKLAISYCSFLALFGGARVAGALLAHGSVTPLNLANLLFGGRAM